MSSARAVGRLARARAERKVVTASGGEGGCVCEDYHQGLRGGEEYYGGEPHEPGVDAILSDSATSA